MSSVDPIADFIERNQEKWFETIHIGRKLPQYVRRSQRWLMPSFIYPTLQKVFASEYLRIVEDENLPWDILLFDARISFKWVTSEDNKVIPRKYKNGNGAMTQPLGIQLKNTAGSQVLYPDEFDYLLVADSYYWERKPTVIYLLDYDRVRKLIDDESNPSGYKDGQIKVYIPSREFCLLCLEESKATISSLEKKDAEYMTRNAANVWWRDRLQQVVMHYLGVIRPDLHG